MRHLQKNIILALAFLLTLTGCKHEGSAFSSADSLVPSLSETPSSENSELNIEKSGIDWLSGNDYYKSLANSQDELTDLARLLRSTLRYATYGDARYNYTTSTKTGGQYVLYDTSGKKIDFKWVGQGGVPVADGTTIEIDREHIWARHNMRIRPVNKSTGNTTFTTYEKDTDGSFYKNGISNEMRGHSSDWHNLWNSVKYWNNDHGNAFFGATNLTSSQTEPGQQKNGWYPGAEYVGDIARALFYMTLTYPFLTLVPSSSSQKEGSVYYGNLDYLLAWNEMDPVSPEEIERNEKIFSGQKNRNPFIDFYDQDIASFVFKNGDPEIPQ